MFGTVWVDFPARVCSYAYKHFKGRKLENTKNFPGNTEKNKLCFLTHVKALRSRVALLVPLAASEFHELDVQLIQNAPLHRVHRVCELWTETPGRPS